MAVIKCKMCGGDLNLAAGQSVAECEYCGSTQTVPNADNDKKLTLFGRANRLRAACDFDKAAGIYESIIADFPEEAEAYWGLVLCKYGIEYVDDPATGKKIPTCHRSSYDSVMDDDNLEQAVENADVVAQKVYREEAKQLERIRKGILEVSAAEQPYDIFICYKETDEKGDRTLDSVLAQDLYSALTDKGYRVFFSRITLQGKLGEAYEPYIFAALNSAKVMLAVGTRYEYYNAVWVKNEWSRYLKICEADKSKHLIPCFKDLDPEDMPKEFNHLQGADLGKMGAIQDILFNMEKYIPLKKTTNVIQERVVVGGGGGNTAALIKRGNMALEDGEWEKADQFFEEALNQDAECAEAYLGKTLAQEHCAGLDVFAKKRISAGGNETAHSTIHENSEHIRKMAEKLALSGYLSSNEITALYRYDKLDYNVTAPARYRRYEEESRYWSGHKLLSRAEQFAKGDTARILQETKEKIFSALQEKIDRAKAEDADARQVKLNRYSEFLAAADKKAAELRAAAEEQREADYITGCNLMDCAGTPAELVRAAKCFDALGDYKDCAHRAVLCREKEKGLRMEEALIAEEKKAEQQRIAAAEEAERKRIAAEQAAEAERLRMIAAREAKARAARKRILGIILGAIAVVAVASLVLITQVIMPKNKYQDANALLKVKDYENAYALFTELGDYKDSAELVSKTAYAWAEKELDQDNTARAAILFGKASEYSDARERSLAIWDEIAVRKTVDVGSYYTIALCNDGTAVYSGEPINDSDIGHWDNLIAVSGGDNMAGLRRDGSVVYASEYVDVSSWTDVVAIESAYGLVGLKMDGTVCASDSSIQKAVADWSDICAIAVAGSDVFGLKYDGTVVASRGYEDTKNWTDIIQIAADQQHVVGLKADGTVVAVNDGYSGSVEELMVEKWTDIVSVEAGYFVTYGLRKDGTLVSTHTDEIDLDAIKQQKYAVAISAQYLGVAVLHANGEIFACGHGDQWAGAADLENVQIPDNDIVRRMEEEHRIKRQEYLDNGQHAEYVIYCAERNLTPDFADIVIPAEECDKLFNAVSDTYNVAENDIRDFDLFYHNVEPYLSVLPEDHAGIADFRILSELMSKYDMGDSYEYAAELFRAELPTLKTLWETELIRKIFLADDNICGFMLGRWYDANGNYIEFLDGGSVEYNIPWPDKSNVAYYDVIDCELIFEDSDGNKVASVYKFDFLSADVVNVYCFEDGNTYTLTRED